MGLLRILIILLLFPSISLAADQTAASCNNTTGTLDIQAAVTAAGDGDTVFIPAGTCTWDETIDMSGKTRVFVGAGSAATIITGDSGYFTTMTTAGKASLSGVKLIDGDFTTGGADFKIYDNIFESVQIVVRGYDGTHPTGVVYNNSFTLGRVVVYGQTYQISDGSDNQHTIWAQAQTFGDANAVYVEGNTYNKVTNDINNAIDGSGGSRYVFRYNTITTDGADTQSTYLESHSMQCGAGNCATAQTRGAQRWEIYNNSIAAGSSGNNAIWMRGGTGVIFNNSITGTWTRYLVFDNRRSYDTLFVTNDNNSIAGRCDGDSTLDGNADATGWPCRDQIGRGYDSAACAGATWTSGECPQVSVPAYLWNNTKEAGAAVSITIINTPSEDHIQANRDYYNLTTKPGYAPYTCPHPLTGLAGSCTATAGTGGYNVTAGTTISGAGTITIGGSGAITIR